MVELYSLGDFRHVNEGAYWAVLSDVCFVFFFVYRRNVTYFPLVGVAISVKTSLKDGLQRFIKSM